MYPGGSPGICINKQSNTPCELIGLCCVDGDINYFKKLYSVSRFRGMSTLRVTLADNTSSRC